MLPMGLGALINLVPQPCRVREALSFALSFSLFAYAIRCILFVSSMDLVCTDLLGIGLFRTCRFPKVLVLHKKMCFGVPQYEVHRGVSVLLCIYTSMYICIYARRE